MKKMPITAIEARNPLVQKCRPRAMRDDYLVHEVARRAIRVVIPDNRHDLSEFETYNLALEAAKVAKKKGWKSITVEVGFARAYCRNASRCAPILLGDIRDITHEDHFLNDPYYSPKGFWIKPCNPPQIVVPA